MAELATARRSATWEQLRAVATLLVQQRGLSEFYQQRLAFELKEIEKQGSASYWVDLFNEEQHFDSNPNRLLLPWLLGMVDLDPVAEHNPELDGPLLTTSDYKTVIGASEQLGGKLPVGIYQDMDKPDIDLDCLPDARDDIKQYAQQRYGGNNLPDESAEYGYVCSVGTWQTYLLRSGLIDAFKALGQGGKSEILAVTKALPDEVDDLKDGGWSNCKNKIGDKECGTNHNQVTCPSCGSDATETPTLARLLQEHQVLREFNDKHPHVVNYAARLVGRIKTMGMHAGALIIADRPLYGNLPLAARRGKDKLTGERKTTWTSMWTEGRSTQLSKFGYNKWDILGLKNLLYISTCCQLIEKNRKIRFGDRLEGWEDIDPLQNRVGWYEQWDGQEWVRHDIPLDDPAVFKLASEQKTDAVFQFDTSLAKRILSNGVDCFDDLMLLNACGHPGPMDSIPEIVANRDGGNVGWEQALKELDQAFYDVLKDTYGHIVYQEQLATIWQVIAGFTSPEAQDARKAVAKKWKHLLKPIEAKWMAGASRRIGPEQAAEWWKKMVTFGRYAFNKCLHAGTPITDQSTGTTKTISEWFESGTSPGALLAWDGQSVVTDECMAIHDNGEQEVFEITFDDGHTELVTLGHRFLCDDGEYHTVAEIFDRGLEVTNSGAG